MGVDEKRAQEIIRDNQHGERGTPVKKTVRDVAFEILVKRLMPEHMHPEPETKPVRPPVLPLEGISPSAARGVAKAVQAGLVSHSNWLRIYEVYEQIRVSAGDREP